MIKVNVRDHQSVPVLALSGNFDVLSAPEIRAMWPSLITESSPNLLVDMAEVDFIDSTALATLVSGLKTARRLNGFFRLYGLQQPVQFVFEITRLSQAFEIYKDADAAIAGPQNG